MSLLVLKTFPSANRLLRAVAKRLRDHRQAWTQRQNPHTRPVQPRRCTLGCRDRRGRCRCGGMSIERSQHASPADWMVCWTDRDVLIPQGAFPWKKHTIHHRNSNRSDRVRTTHKLSPPRLTVVLDMSRVKERRSGSALKIAFDRISSTF